MKRYAKRIWQEIRRFLDGIDRHGVAVHAASGAFYMFLSLTPFFILVCSVLPYTPLTEEIILSHARDIVPTGAIDLIESIVSDVYGASVALVPVSALAILWSAGKAFSSLIRGMEEINDAPKRTRFIMRRLRAMLYTLLLLLAKKNHLTNTKRKSSKSRDTRILLDRYIRYRS